MKWRLKVDEHKASIASLSCPGALIDFLHHEPIFFSMKGFRSLFIRSRETIKLLAAVLIFISLGFIILGPTNTIKRDQLIKVLHSDIESGSLKVVGSYGVDLISLKDRSLQDNFVEAIMKSEVLSSSDRMPIRGGRQDIDLKGKNTNYDISVYLHGNQPRLVLKITTSGEINGLIILSIPSELMLIRDEVVHSPEKGR